MDMNSPMFFFLPYPPFVICRPVSEFVEACGKKEICMNCRHFRQTEDWHEALEGFYLPKGECCYNPPTHDGFPKLNGGKTCSKFSRKTDGKAGEGTETGEAANAQDGIPSWKRARMECKAGREASGSMPGWKRARQAHGQKQDGNSKAGQEEHHGK